MALVTRPLDLSDLSRLSLRGSLHPSYSAAASGDPHGEVQLASEWRWVPPPPPPTSLSDEQDTMESSPLPNAHC